MTQRSRRADARSAAEWFAVMRGPDADAERAAFETWRALPANAEAYARLDATWDESLFLANSRTGRDRDLMRVRRKMPPAALLAAGIALLTLLSAGLMTAQMGWLGSAGTQTPAATTIAAVDGVRTLTLADGSKVTLDRDAALSDLSSPRERRFTLLRGRARFDVAHDPARSFIVDAGAGSVIAHGTLFDVGFEDGAVRVVLLKGSVEVRDRQAAKSSPHGSRLLAPGEELVMRVGIMGVPSRTDASRLAWTEPMIGFDEVPLAEAVAAFNRGGGQAVRIERGGDGAKRVSGAFRRDDPKSFADALGASFGMTVETTADGSLLLREGKSDVR
ncbi:FecR/PupR family sigma factor regulatory protein [uncultured Sphingopyxis sp.]|uniref:FecR/PupR family sigma factor regulatory protein n=1 Tax=uncultured Sphingopyxis sp. TaxID=310581 RepID=A0A1Y5PST8_9SPHN|nr:FecR domain-containing protein [uncultured Sphingopyxis sp.]SBV31776.1 FecR/PupR family sigma factor regulatory protein [uncultured Sphingopyxis sp.]